MFTKKNLILLIGRHTLLAFSVAISSLIIIVFLSNQITKISDSVIKSKKLANTLLERTTHIEKLKHEASVIGANDTIINNAFVPSDDIAEFISALESLSLKNSVTQVFRFDSPIPSTIHSPFLINTVAYNNSLSATLSSFIKYTKDFESMHYFTKMNGFAITSQTPAGINGASSVSFQAILYTKATQ